jgi:four helix bundle protein
MNNVKKEKPDILTNKSFEFSVKIICYVRDSGSNDFALGIIYKQIIRSATSIGANINEAKGSISKKDFTLFFSHAFKSALETEYWLLLLEKTSGSKVDFLLSNCRELIKLLAKKFDYP